MPSAPSAPTVLDTLTSFSGTNGAYPLARLVADASGDLFGTTEDGGAYGPGTGEIFELIRTNGVYSSTPTVLASFNGTDGADSRSDLIADASGNLFGTTGQGGATGKGTVFELTKTDGGYSSTPTVLASFSGPDGAYPLAGLIADGSGNLFGTTQQGGASGTGTVFEITKTGGVYSSTPTLLASFTGGNGSYPTAGLIADASGNLFGTTEYGGATGSGGPVMIVGAPAGYGVVFELTKTDGVYSSTPTILVSFNGPDGEYSAAGLIADASGDLFGTTEYGGAGYGTLFEITQANGVYSDTPTVLVSFDQTGGFHPVAGLMADASGDLFGTTESGGANGDGTVFELTRTNGSYSDTPTFLASLNRNNSPDPSSVSGLIAGPSGDLFGATEVGGASGAGTIFVVTHPPTVTLTSPAEQGIQAMQTLTGTVTSGGSASTAGQIVTFTDNGVALASNGPVTSDANGNFTAEVTLLNQGDNAIVATSQDSYGNIATSLAVTDTLTLPAAPPPAGPAGDITPPSVGFDADVSFSSPTKVTFTGTVSDSVGVASVELFEGGSDLGAATLTGDGTWSFAADLGRGPQTGFVAVATDTAGNTASAPSDFDLTTGVRSPIPGQPYTAVEDNYGTDGGFLGQTFFQRHGAVLFSSSFAVLPNGDLSYSYSGGTFFNDKPYSSFTDDYTAPAIPAALEVLDNTDGSHTITAQEGGVALHSIGSDTMIGAGARDRFVFSPGFGADTITDFVVGGRGHDTLVLPNADASRLAQILASAHTVSGDTTLHLNRQDSITLQGVTLAEIRNHPHDFKFHG